jgi:hypothetical protein
MLTKEDLVGLGMTPGPLFAQVFKAVKSARTKEEAIAIAMAIRDGTFTRKERQTKVIDPDSCLHWFLENRSWLPSGENRGHEPSISEIRRMLEQGSITFNGRKPKAEEKMEFPIWELVFFKGSKTQCTLFFDRSIAPPWATWNTIVHERQPNPKGGDDLWVVVGEVWHTNDEPTNAQPLEREEVRVPRMRTSVWDDLKTRLRCRWFLSFQPRVSAIRRKIRETC